ncbi:MAG: SpoVR family protein [bacterium]
MSDYEKQLRIAKEEIEEYARAYGLDFFETIFEVVDYDQMNELASFGGFPNRYPHWRFGMEYEQMRKSYAYGLHRIYEMVINNDPAYAYLLKSNKLVDQKLTMAHVYAHVDFFKNNLWFAHTNRHMIDKMANHATRIRRHKERVGPEVVEDFIDTCLSLENLIDYHAPFINRKSKVDVDDDEIRRSPAFKMKSKYYMDSFVNPKEFLEQQKSEHEDKIRGGESFPAMPGKDVLQFLIEFAPLKRWQQDVLSIIREEAYYFAPQGQTKIMNEGWATYWHSRMMTERIVTDAELVDYADHHSGTVSPSPGRLNPYKLGVDLFRHIKNRWDKGQFGKEYEECDDIYARKNWDKKLGLGNEKIYEVRGLYNDVTFIDAFLTEDFVRDVQFFTYEYNEHDKIYRIDSREFKKIKSKLLSSLTNLGQPDITVEDANYGNRGELYLVHRGEGAGLQFDYAKATLQNLYKIWTRPVMIESIFGENPTVLVFDGNDFKQQLPESSIKEEEVVTTA